MGETSVTFARFDNVKTFRYFERLNVL